MEPFDDTVYANDGAEFLTEHNRASGLGDEEDRLSLSQVRLSISNSSVVNNGLKLRCGRDMKSFSYTNFEFTSVTINWMYMATDNVDRDNIRVHQLKAEDDISNILNSYEPNYTKAVVFISFEDHFKPPCNLLVNTMEAPYPLLMVKKSDGEEILAFMNKGEDTYGCIDAGVTLEEDLGSSVDHCTDISTDSSWTQVGYSKRQEVAELKANLKRLLFNSASICQDRSRFIDVMGAFNKYQREAIDKENHHELGGIFKKLWNCVMANFKKDFPFYIILVFRMHRKGPKYDCNEMRDFVVNFLFNMEFKLKPEVLASVLMTFIKQDNFNLPIEGEGKECRVFDLLESACLELSEVSLKTHYTKKTKPVYENFLRARMLWISIVMKLREIQKKPPGETTWKDAVLKFSHRIKFNHDVLGALDTGLQIGLCLQLSTEYSFNFQHLGDLFIGGSSVRPFKHITDGLKTIQKYFKAPEHLLVFLTLLLAEYDRRFASPGETKFKGMSSAGTLAGCLDEGISFLDTLEPILESKSLPLRTVETVMMRWLEQLLRITDLTGPNPAQHLKFLLSKQHQVTRKYATKIKKCIINDAEKKLPELSIQQFFQLHKSLSDIWPGSFIQKFLDDYVIPTDIIISDDTWKEFFNYVCRASQYHSCIAEFLKRVAQKYLESGREVHFIFDLLKLTINDFLSAKMEDKASELKKAFSKFLHEYINKNGLQLSLLSKPQKIFTFLSDQKDDFQLLVLDVLCHDMVPSMKTLSGNDLRNFESLLTESIKHLNKLGWLTSDSSKQRFCWGILTSTCSKIKISSDKMDWVHLYCSIFPSELKLGIVFSSYCAKKRLPKDQCIVNEIFLEGIQFSTQDTHKYFEWVAKIHTCLQSWSDKFLYQRISYDEICLYSSIHEYVSAVGEGLCASKLIIGKEEVQSCKITFLNEFEMLNVLLLLYIPNRPSAKWCALPQLLEKYGVYLPEEVKDFLDRSVNIPDYGCQKPEQQLSSPIDLRTSEKFKPHQNISLRLCKNVTLKELFYYVSRVQDFQKLLSEHDLNMFTFFHLKKSKLFDKYLRHYLEKQPQGEATGGLPVQSLVNALKDTSELISKIIQGTATYSEMITMDKSLLEQVEIQNEFKILSDYIGSGITEGLEQVKNMIELFQYTGYIKSIKLACEQYQLQACTEDPCMKELIQIMKENMSKENRLSMTPAMASGKIKRVKEILCLGAKSSSKCLDIFAAVADSVAIYNFVKEKQFYGEKGQEIFLQQYRLITAQLQHESYDEQVLNHLFAAVKVISPFMEPNCFNDLMTKVTSQNAVSGVKHLETVNKNITLIQLWFSRAEGDTFENVEKELDSVIETGRYTFYQEEIDELGRNKAQLYLEFEPASIQFPAESTVQSLGPKLQVGFGSSRKELWNQDQIADFVRKLGFVDKSKEEKEEKIQYFLYLNQAVHKLFELYLKLRELGHPKYSSKDGTQPIPCSMSIEDANILTQETEQALDAWTSEVAELCDKYPWLLYFSVPRMLQLYRLIVPTASDDAIELRIVHEVSFLNINRPAAGEEMKQWVQRALVRTMTMSQHGVDSSPMQQVGQFLTMLLQDHTLCIRQFPKGDMLRLPQYHHSVTTFFTQPLYLCPNYSQTDLQYLILSIFSGTPEAWQMLRCHSTTTEEEVSLFLKRVEKHHTHYLLLDVNKLPFKLQEHLVRVHLSVQRNYQQAGMSNKDISVIHFVETSPSMLREMPWIQLKDAKNYQLSVAEKEEICRCTKAKSECDFASIELVYGSAGNGKTHYIKKRLEECAEQITISVNEGFTPLKAINKLRSLPLYKRNVGLFFNFTLLPPGDSAIEREKLHYREFMENIGWFFFDLLVLGYVEDHRTGLSFRLPGGLDWAIYIEVPYQDRFKEEDSFKLLCSEVPALDLFGTPHHVNHEVPFCVDSDVQLVCKYLRAYKTGRIDELYREIHKQKIKFSNDRNLSEEECQALLKEYMPKHQRLAPTKITQQLFVRYMKRRCEFLDNLPQFNYNPGVGHEIGKEKTNTKRLGSTLLETMLKEVSDFCDPDIKENRSLKPHQQLIYDFKDGGASLGVISLQPENLPEEQNAKFVEIGIKIPSMIELHSRKLLDSYLSRAFNVPLDNGRLSTVDDSAYVLTLDYAIKMLNIHERCQCGVPIVIEGETGVGKTALVEMLSRLWNQSLLLEWKRDHENILEFFRRKLSDATDFTTPSTYKECLEAIAHVSSGEFTMESLLLLCNQTDGAHGMLYSQINTYLAPMKKYPVVSLLTLKEPCKLSLEELFTNAEQEKSPEATAHLLQAVFSAQLESTFHKINVHAALSPAEIKTLFDPIFKQAKNLQETYRKSLQHVADANETSEPTFTSSFSSANPNRTPFVTVFLDEVNTSSCLGLFKEIIIDRNLDGEQIPENIFIVAACNPHRGDSLASHDDKSWVRGTYYVHSLHPTLKLLKWDYGSLDEHQEKDYIDAKMEIINKGMSQTEIASLTELITTSQNKMRKFALDQLTNYSKVKNRKLASISSRSCVSQRDIQRVFTFYQWFKNMYDKHKPYGVRSDYHRRAVLVSLGLVYYMRLNSRYRTEYAQYLDGVNRFQNEVTFSEAFKEELDYYINQVELPKGVARTTALKENIFAIIICTVTHTPLIIVGAPGSSKTISFNLTIANLKGQESKRKLFRNTDTFCALDPHHYQCSRRTTSNEIETVFLRAIKRQRTHHQFHLPIYCVVFMDEAGLPEESHESLKVLHYHLDKKEVSFVAITNNLLDAAKTNRAISLYRPEASNEDLEMLAKGCLCLNPEKPPPELRAYIDTVVKFCYPYARCMRTTTFSNFFGLRDFIHFVNYFRRKRDEGKPLTAQLVMQALERNFSGVESLESNFKNLLLNTGIQDKYVLRHRRNILEVLQDSMQDKPHAMKNPSEHKVKSNSTQDKPQVVKDVSENEGMLSSMQGKPLATKDLSENEVRFKLIIDPSEDDSLIRLLFTIHAMDRENTRLFVCSDFPGDSEVQKINTIAAIRHSAMQGHTVVLSQTDNIHESFYDLFNQRFRRIDDPLCACKHHPDSDDCKHHPRYYTNIAIGAHNKPSRVNPEFQCVVVIKKSEVNTTPAAFLNRFEKYLISHRSLLEITFQRLPPCLTIIVKVAKEKVNEFICLVLGYKSLYGVQYETLDSLLLELLPPIDHCYKKSENTENQCEAESLILVDDPFEMAVYLFQEILIALRNNAGFYVPKFRRDELERDVDHVCNLIMCDPKFEGTLKNMKRRDIARAAVSEAFNLLFSAPGPGGDQLDLTPDACMVIAILQQLLIRLLTKRLMNLMTAEAVILNRKKIPYSYLGHYISNQAHFSLKDMIKNYHRALAATPLDSSRSVNKLVCYTRSSTRVHALPSQFPHSVQDHFLAVKELVFDDTDKLMMYKLSSLPSQSALQELLKEFVNSRKAEVLVLLANMQKTSRKTINHIRIMIEEEELKAKDQSCKLFVVLLHFSPAQFFQHCYPVLFLKGWDHTYLDTITYNTAKDVVDMQDWFCRCCFPAEELNPGNPDMLLQALSQLLEVPQAISVISSQVYFGTKKDSSFNSSMNATERADALLTLFHDRGLGEILCKKFRTYWSPKVMAEYLEWAATFSKHMESTLNITDSIQAKVEELFMYFCIYMLSHINEDFNLNIVYDKDASSSTRKLFLDILSVIPVPKLSQLNFLVNNLPALQTPVHCPQFPFFKLVYTLMEKEVELRGEAANLKLDLLTEQSHISEDSADSKLQALVEVVSASLKSQSAGDSDSQQVLGLVISAMTSDVELWHCYFKDFTAYKLSLINVNSNEVPIVSNFALDVLQKHFQYLDKYEAPQRMAELHILIYHLQIEKMATMLRPFVNISMLEQGPSVFSSAKHTPVSPVSQFLKKFELPHNIASSLVLKKSELTQNLTSSLVHVSSLVISTLFNSLMSAAFSDAAPTTALDKLSAWFKSYRDIMSLPTVKYNVYSSLRLHGSDSDVIPYEAMFNLVQSTFVILQSTPTFEGNSQETLSNGQRNFHILFLRFFEPEESMKLKSPTQRPGLAGVLEVAMEVTASTTRQFVLESMLTHFFSPLRPGYYTEDVKWFLEVTNKQMQWNGSSCKVILMELNVCKFHLLHILGKNADKQDAESKGIFHFNQHIRSLIGKVLNEDEKLGHPEPYVPLFATTNESALSERMQQPLCHLYFLTVMEHIQSTRQQDHSSLASMKFATRIEQELITAKEIDGILLRVELQAVIQNLMQELSLYLSPSHPYKLEDDSDLLLQINKFLDEDSAAHGIVLALHLLKLFKSLQTFVDFMTKKYDTHIHCLEPIHHQLQKVAPDPEWKPHLLPFLRQKVGSELYVLYKQMTETMLAISDGSEESSELISLALNCTKKKNGHQNFRMVLWLVVYYNFYLENKFSSILCNELGSTEMQKYMQTQEYVQLVQCFLQPSRMQRHQAKEKMNPIYELFRPDNLRKQDQSDTDLRHSLANLIAVVLGCPPQSNHLWFHMFAPDRLEKTYMTGFMYNAPVGCDGRLYDRGVKLSPEGLFGREDYKEHASRGTYTLHSLYLLLWANFGSFCISLLTQPNSYNLISGKVISKRLSLAHYCMSQLKSCWKYIRNNLRLTDEQRVFFVAGCLEKFLQLFSSPQSPTSAITNMGVFSTCEDLNMYERLWHTCVYQPVWDKQASKFAKIITSLQSKLIGDIRAIELGYPHFPSEDELIHSILSSGDLQKHSKGGKLSLLAKFTMERPLLHKGEVLLPDLVELYQWLHKDIAHLLTYEKASSITIDQVVSFARKKLNKQDGEHICNLYQRVKSNYNQYVTLIGSKSISISDSTSLLCFLTDVEAEGKGNDWLYLVIADIATRHNQMIKNFYSAAKHGSMARLLPDEPAKVLLTEFDSNSAIIDDSTQLDGKGTYVQLIRRRYQNEKRTFQFQQLEEDFVAEFIAGKPLIELPGQLRKVFQFKKELNELQDFSDHLPNTFKVDLPGDHTMKIEFYFHSANYHLLIELQKALKTVIGHLIKALKKDNPDSSMNDKSLEMTVSEFLHHLYGDSESSTDDMFAKIGIKREACPHIRCLADLPLTATYSCLRLFVNWVEKGFYDYNTLPYHLKRRMDSGDEEALERVVDEWQGKDLMEKLQELTKVLKESEHDLASGANDANKPISEYVQQRHSSKLDVLIPPTIKIRHYVEFRLTLRRLQQKVEQQLNKRRENESIKWTEFVYDLWEKHLPHFWEEIYTYGEYLPEFHPQYGFHEENAEDDAHEYSMAGLSQEEVGQDMEATSLVTSRPARPPLRLEELQQMLEADPEMRKKVSQLFAAKDSNRAQEETSPPPKTKLPKVLGGTVLAQSDGGDSSSASPSTTASLPDDPAQFTVAELPGNTPQAQVPDEERFMAKKSTSVTAVKEFLTRIGLSQYTQAFEEKNIDGKTLLEADPTFLASLHVTSPLHQMKIMQLFRREVHGTAVSYSNEHLTQFLRQHKLDMHIATLKEHWIDGDMILDVEKSLMESVLEEIGVGPPINTMMISLYQAVTPRTVP